MASWQEEIRYGQSVWCDHKNGVIVLIDYQDRTVMVDFYDKGYQSFEFDELIGSFDEALNQWVVAPLI